MSAATREKMRVAQQTRWAKLKDALAAKKKGRDDARGQGEDCGSNEGTLGRQEGCCCIEA